MTTLQRHIDKALDLSTNGYFFSKSQQKEALDHLNRAFDAIRNTQWDGELMQKSTPEERWELSCNIPSSLHLVKEWNRHMFVKLSMDCDTIFELVSYRNAFKNFEIVPQTKENNDYAQVMKFIVSGVQSNFQDDGRNYLKERLGRPIQTSAMGLAFRKKLKRYRLHQSILVS